MFKQKENDYNNVYKIKTKNKLDLKRIFVVIVLILIVIALIVISKNAIISIETSKETQQYQAQLEAMQKEEEEKQAQIAAEAEAKRQEKIPKLTEAGRTNMENIYHSETKKVFLTFDDGPSNVTPTILDTLKQEKVVATFFVLGSKVEVFPETTKRIYEEGHYIANHGYSHSYSSIYSSAQATLDEYNQCNDVVKNTIGIPEYNSHLFRFPGGKNGGPYDSVKQEAKELLSQNDILNIDWNALTGDAESTNPTSEKLMSRLQETTSNRNSIVLLMHDAQAKKVTADTLPQIIAYLKEQGYEFKNFYDIIK